MDLDLVTIESEHIDLRKATQSNSAFLESGMTNVKETPTFSAGDAANLVRELFGIQGAAHPLPSERDQNFQIIADDNQFVFKIANAYENREMLDAEIRVMEFLSWETGLCPRIVPSLDGESMTAVPSRGGSTHYVRLVNYLPGRTMATVKRHSPELMRSLGNCLGDFDRALAGFDHPAVHREFRWDLAKALKTVARHRPLVEDGSLNEFIDVVVREFESEVAPILPKLRTSVIHNDANDHNVIVGGGEDIYSRNQRVTGIIDFGDMVYSATIGNLAVAVAYAFLDRPDPLETAIEIVRGYNEKFSLTEDELAALFCLIRMRLCLSICLAAYQKQQRPEDDYLVISQEPIRRILPKLAAIHPRFAHAAFRNACGLEPVPGIARIRKWLMANANTISPVFGEASKADSCVAINLGIGNPLIEGDPELVAEPDLTRRIFRRMEAAGANVGIGGYGEARAIYLRPEFRTGDSMVGEHRAVHLGIDLFVLPGTPVYAPLPATVFAFHENKNEFDYGPVIILEHKTEDGETFFTLYGHLERESLSGLKKGQKIGKGERIGAVGSADVNGGWTPHLHFQLIVDLLDLDCDFPGVCLYRQVPVWQSFSPDPNLILQLPIEHISRRHAEKSQLLSKRREHIGRNLSIGYRNPLVIERGWMQYLYDETGRKYIDAYNNVPHVGHCHPRVVEAARRQMVVLNTNTRYLHRYLQEYAEKLCATLPSPLKVCYFVNSGSEANELALRLSRAHTGKRDLIVLEGAYHGHTTSLIDISPYKHKGPGGSGTPDWVHAAPVADVYRGQYKGSDEDAGGKYALQVKQIIERMEEQGRGLCGFIAETCPSVGGQIIFPPGYLSAVYQYVRAAGGVCIADEVQTAYGRMGTHFYAFEAQEVVPDIVVLGKPIGNGHPISAVITSADIAASFDNGMEFFSTFGGNTVSCAVGMAVLDIVREENLQAHALEVGNHLIEGLRSFLGKHQLVGDVRGSGLFIGIELVKDRESLEPATEEAAFIANRMRENGILLGTDGPWHNVIKIRPPMPFSKDNADQLVTTFARILEEDF